VVPPDRKYSYFIFFKVKGLQKLGGKYSTSLIMDTMTSMINRRTFQKMNVHRWDENQGKRYFTMTYENAEKWKV
jgi:hypothetical protein